MKFLGYIKTQKRIVVDDRECYGLTTAYGSRFSIRVAEETTDNFYLFAETVLHELIHLWLFILMACTRTSITERQQHMIINKIMPHVWKPLTKYYARRIK